MVRVRTDPLPTPRRKGQLVKILVLDIETSPNLAWVWGLWQQNVAINQIEKSGAVLCFAAKWVGEDKVRFHKGPALVGAAHKLLDQADVVVHYNGTKFDIPWLQTEFVRAGLTQPSPFTQIDLCSVVKAKFRFPSNKLEYVANALLEEGKVSTGGFGLWLKVMGDDKAAWAAMRRYNEHDVLLTERLFERLKPWIKLPVASLYDGDTNEKTCPQCGSDNIQRRGLAYTPLGAYQQYRCMECGRWSRGKNRVKGVDVR